MTSARCVCAVPILSMSSSRTATDGSAAFHMRWLARRSRVRFHFTPTSASRLNLVERLQRARRAPAPITATHTYARLSLHVRRLSIVQGAAPVGEMVCRLSRFIKDDFLIIPRQPEATSCPSRSTSVLDVRAIESP